MAAGKKSIVEKKIELAKRPDTKVVFTRTPESHMLVLILSQADIGISTLKRNLLQDGFSVEEVQALLNEFYANCRALESTVEKISSKCGYKYKKAKELVSKQ
ncbi:putative cytoplasmic protein [Denitrovibrio acetiphilus DSM 12809]|uniref:Putative cytoplasmic protein n=1 Tax=Denitrovibrio acetiphilus (strain DSM 12809 / NBRC 114555 / N2460) TaxID=522772 RepID=D4H470_DENA2|nr:hypothetical protein [Denitrovibrio acetiphilus]ADD67381.1 putative cytoplasmic protein [Denitrovibrio acetiphilus DSM 12809]